MNCATQGQCISLKKFPKLWKQSVNKVIFLNGGLGGMLDAIILYLHCEDLICQGLIWLNLGAHSSNVDKRLPLLLQLGEI